MIGSLLVLYLLCPWFTASTALASISNLFSSFSSTIAVVNIFSDNCLFLASVIYCSLLSSCNFLSIFNVGLSLYWLRAWTTRRKAWEFKLRTSTTETTKVSKVSKSTESSKALGEWISMSNIWTASKVTEASKTSKVIIVISEPTKWISLLLLSLGLLFLLLLRSVSESTKATKWSKVIIVIKEALEWVSSTKEVFKYILGMLERKWSEIIPSLESPKWATSRSNSCYTMS